MVEEETKTLISNLFFSFKILLPMQLVPARSTVLSVAVNSVRLALLKAIPEFLFIKKNAELIRSQGFHFNDFTTILLFYYSYVILLH